MGTVKPLSMCPDSWNTAHHRFSDGIRYFLDSIERGGENMLSVPKA
jgi:hypothetical protein